MIGAFTFCFCMQTCQPGQLLGDFEKIIQTQMLLLLELLLELLMELLLLLLLLLLQMLLPRRQ